MGTFRVRLSKSHMDCKHAHCIGIGSEWTHRHVDPEALFLCCMQLLINMQLNEHIIQELYEKKPRPGKSWVKNTEFE